VLSSSYVKHKIKALAEKRSEGEAVFRSKDDDLLHQEGLNSTQDGAKHREELGIGVTVRIGEYLYHGNYKQGHRMPCFA